MKKIFLSLIALVFLVCEYAPAQSNNPHIWKYSAANTIRTNFADDGTFTWYTAARDTLTSLAFGPSSRFTWNSWNGLLGVTMQIDTVAGTTTVDTFYFYLIHDMGVGNVTEPDTLNWQNCNDSTETTPYIALPADHGKVWKWQNNRTGHFLQKFPDNKYYMRMISVGADTAAIKQQYFGY